MIKIAVVFMTAVWAAAGSAWAQTEAPVTITLSNYAFTPAAIVLTSGALMHLHFTNSGSKDHDFSAPEFFAAALVAPEDQAKVQKGKVAVESGQSVDIAVTPGPPGTFAVECTHFMHKMMGMHGTITVQ